MCPDSGVGAHSQVSHILWPCGCLAEVWSHSSEALNCGCESRQPPQLVSNNNCSRTAPTATYIHRSGPYPPPRSPDPGPDPTVTCLAQHAVLWAGSACLIVWSTSISTFLSWLWPGHREPWAPQCLVQQLTAIYSQYTINSHITPPRQQSHSSLTSSILQFNHNFMISTSSLTYPGSVFCLLFWVSSANHRAGYFSNPPCDWPSTAWAYFKQETENGPWWDTIHKLGPIHAAGANILRAQCHKYSRLCRLEPSNPVMTQLNTVAEAKWQPFCRHFKYIFLNENVWILLQISLKFVLKGWINNISPLV